MTCCLLLFFQAEDGIRDLTVTGVQTCALPISSISRATSRRASPSNKRLGHTGGGGRTERTELFACLHGLRDAVALDRAVPLALEESLRRLREQHQLRDVCGAGAPLQLLDDETAEAASAPMWRDGHRAQQCYGCKTLQGAGADELGVLVSDDELGLRGGEGARSGERRVGEEC